MIGLCWSVGLFVSMLSVFNHHKLCCGADIDNIDWTDDRTAADVDLQNIHCLPAIRLPAICLCFLFLFPLVWFCQSLPCLSFTLAVSHKFSMSLTGSVRSLVTLMLSAWEHDEYVHKGPMHRSWVVWKTVAKPSKWS